MAAVHGPTLAQHPTSFQAHNIPVSRMGFHPAPPPVVSISYLSFILPLFTFSPACKGSPATAC